jgi:hypothetical protein
MNELQQELFEQQLASVAKGMDYPRTPDIAASVMRRLSAGQAEERAPARSRSISRRMAWSLAMVLLLLSSLMLIPPVRAAILEVIEIGAVRIFRSEPTPLPPPQDEVSPPLPPVTATPTDFLPFRIPALADIDGETDLARAQAMVDYPILVPSYPPGLGQPDRVYVQDAEGPMTILVWVDPPALTDTRLVLHLIPKGSWAVEKMSPRLIEETRVNGQRAVWALGPYPIRFRNGNLEFARMVDGHVLIWTDGDVTYRLETDLTLEEAIRIAESLEAVP